MAMAESTPQTAAPARKRRTQAERSSTTIGEIVTAARELFATQGFADTSIEEIVVAAGVTRGALYHHFDSKAAVFRAVLAGEVHGLGKAAIDEMQGITDPSELISRSIRAVLEYCSDPEVHRIMFDDAGSVIPVGELRDMREDRGFPFFRTAIEAAMAEGAISKRQVEPPMYVLYGAVRGLAAWVSRAEDREAALKAAGDELDTLLAAL
jgi:AcrR family transcriptional regulator